MLDSSCFKLKGLLYNARHNMGIIAFFSGCMFEVMLVNVHEMGEFWYMYN